MDSDILCTDLAFELFPNEDCSGPANSFDASKFTLDQVNQQVLVTTSSPFLEETLCVKAESLGKVSAINSVKVEVCGSESISIENPTNIEELKYILSQPLVYGELGKEINYVQDALNHG